MMVDIFQHPVFKEAVADIESLGVQVSVSPSNNAVPYAVIGGRSNARWWLLPLTNRHVTVSGLALFQPILKSAQWMKQGVVTLSQMGLGRLWAKPKIYISGEPILKQYFAEQQLSYAFFTGTDSPHRKVAIQIMDERGNIKGFAKLTRNPQVRKLLQHEAATLEFVNNLCLKAVQLPQVSFTGDLAGSTLLVTDTLKTPNTSTTTGFTAAHRAFLQDLSQKTAALHPVLVGTLAKIFRTRFESIRADLDQIWLNRLETAITALEAQPDFELNVGLSHGDFTPWNTFMVNGLLYVFDWEYAERSLPISNDVIHFILNQRQTRSLSALGKIEAATNSLSQPWLGIQIEMIPMLLNIYLLTQILRQLERLPVSLKHSNDWDGAEDTAAMFEVIWPSTLQLTKRHLPCEPNTCTSRAIAHE